MRSVKKMVDGQQVMGMEDVDSLEIPAHGQRTLAPGGDHLMLMGLKSHPVSGDIVKLTLRFEPGGREVTVDVLAKPLTKP